MQENISKWTFLENDFFQKTTDLLADAYLLISSQGVVIAGNASARRLFQSGQLTTASLDALVSDPPEKILRALQRWSGSGSMVPIALSLDNGTLLRCDGARLVSASAGASTLLLVRCVPRNDSLATKQFARHSTDYANLQKKVADKLAGARRRREALETTAAVFAHEIANPLNGIAAALEVLKLHLKDSPDDPEISEVLNGAQEEIARIKALLNDFRAIARPQTFDFRPLDLRNVIDTVLAPGSPAFKSAGIELQTDLDPALPPVLGDRDKLKQAILNICKNAIEAMPTGGCLRIATAVRNGVVVLDIADTGVGMPKGFDPFQMLKSTKPTGAGIGLAITDQIISAHKGTIKFVSEPDRGTTFTIYLPICSK